MKLKPKAFGLACGILWGVSLFLCTVVAVYNGYLSSQLQWLVGFYPWYELSYGGAVIGGVAGFIDGFVGGAIFAWVYNYFACCGSGCCEMKAMPSMKAAPSMKAPAKKKGRRK